MKESVVLGPTQDRITPQSCSSKQRQLAARTCSEGSVEVEGAAETEGLSEGIDVGHWLTEGFIVGYSLGMLEIEGDSLGREEGLADVDG